MQTTINATTPDGKNAVGWLHRAAESPDTLVFIIHGHSSWGDRGRYVTMAKWFEHYGFDACRWNVVRPVLGENKFKTLTATQELEQARALLTKLRPNYKRIVVAGHSQGGMIAAALASEGLADYLVEMMGVFNTTKTLKTKAASFGLDSDAIERGETSAMTTPIGQTFVYSKDFFEDFRTWDMKSIIESFKGPSMFIFGQKDDRIPPDEVREAFSVANEPKILFQVDDFHRFSNESALKISQEIRKWLENQA